jgi:hypothetical protein
MSKRRMKRRIVGALSKRLDELQLEDVADERDPRGKTWLLETVLRTVMLGMAAGAKSCADVETLTDDLSSSARRRFRLSRRLPDTTMRNILCGLTPSALVPVLHRGVRQANRRKAIRHDGFPFGVASLDGKTTTISGSDDWFAQRQSQAETQLTGSVRTVTAALTSSSARPVIDVTTIPAHTNEMGWFPSAFRSLMNAYGPSDLFRLVTYDAGAASLDNAALVREHGVHYLFGLKASQPSLLREAKQLLGDRTNDECDDQQVDTDGTARRVFLAEVAPGLCGWQHLRTFVRVDSERVDKLGKACVDTRYFLSSLPMSRLAPRQWLLAIRRHWGVETVHQVLDVAFEEDDHPWIESNPRGTVVVMMLRRIAYTLLSLFRSLTQRSDERRATPWKALMRTVSTTLVTLTDTDVAGLRLHALAPS